MITLAYFDKERGIDEVWYDSSSLLFSEYNQPTGDLKVVFNGGGQYVYHKVPMSTSYLMFKHGAEGGSQGKSLNKFIKGTYEFEKLENMNLELLNERRNEVQILKNKELLRNRTYFISGHRKITEEQFRKYYKDVIDEILVKNVENHDNPPVFIMGDYYGCDIMAQNYLLDEMEYDPDLVYVYHMFEAPRNVNPKVIHLVGGFKTDEERDAAMTENSFEDIAFVSNHLELSGTAMNLLRRKLMK